MSLDGYWPLAILALLVPAIGHLYHFLILLNTSGGMGFREAKLYRVAVLLFLTMLASAAVLLVGHLKVPWWQWPHPWRTYAIFCVLSGGVLLPLTSLSLRFRKPIDGITEQTTPIEVVEPEKTTPLIGSGRNSWMVRLPGNQSLRPVLREWEIRHPNLPPALDGLSIVHLTDLHFSPAYERSFFDLVVSEVQKQWTADLVVFTGDLVDSNDCREWIEPVLGPLQARHGKYAILGNHDLEHEPDKVIAALDRAGYHFMEGRWESIEIQGRQVLLGGTSEPWRPGPDVASPLPPADFKILLSHTPDQFYQGQQWGVDFMLSGHNHGGQIRLPLLGPLIVPSRFSRRFDRGFFRAAPTLMYVGEGLGAKHPLRYGTRPEVCRFVLRHEPAAEVESAEAVPTTPEAAS